MRLPDHRCSNTCCVRTLRGCSVDLAHPMTATYWNWWSPGSPGEASCSIGVSSSSIVTLPTHGAANPLRVSDYRCAWMTQQSGISLMIFETWRKKKFKYVERNSGLHFNGPEDGISPLRCTARDLKYCIKLHIGLKVWFYYMRCRKRI